eukprot:CAMPEP_0194027284 /NCGR_PEP_ID=MMETSP0009_2-20130614/1457_1 /TAXON_ID=210454 /ORGANISM="Grammatophora oceanica, Strain CCMP 410" /LENGTH=272 /DNA_ID=CAMNT_0038666297 /DNA_START=45 /DNA_END=863 /DNA_ORIENTATION=+
MMRSVFFLVLLLRASVVAQEPTATPVVSTGTPTTTAMPTFTPWSGCTDPKNLEGEDKLITIGKKHTICFSIGPGGNWAAGVSYLRYTFQPIADEYSRFHIPGSYSSLVERDDSPIPGNLTVHVASQDFLSFVRIYYDPDAGRIFPYLTAIIDVQKGVVQGIAWDDACVFCNKGRCVDNMYDFNGNSAASLGVNQPSTGCFLTNEECGEIASEGTGRECDLQLYVVWTGSDKDGKAFQSSPNRFSAFPPGRLQDRILNNLPDLPNFSDFNPFK